MFPPQDENWKIKKNERKIQSISNIFSQAFESLFVLCSFIAARSFLSSFYYGFIFSLLIPAPMVTTEKRSSKENDDKAMGKENKFHGIFLALLLRKNCFVYEFAIHKTFFSSSALFSRRFFYWKIMSFVYEKQRQEFEIYIGFFIGVSFLYFLNSIQVQMLNSRKLIPWYFARISTTWLRDARSTTLSEL